MIGQAWVEDVSLYMNGQLIQAEAPTILENGTTLVPVRFIAEAMGCTVTWEQRKVMITKQDNQQQASVISGPHPSAIDGVPVDKVEVNWH